MPPVRLDRNRKFVWGVTELPLDPPHHRVFATATKTLPHDTQWCTHAYSNLESVRLVT